VTSEVIPQVSSSPIALGQVAEIDREGDSLVVRAAVNLSGSRAVRSAPRAAERFAQGFLECGKPPGPLA
jgi:hypothetical protein